MGGGGGWGVVRSRSATTTDDDWRKKIRQHQRGDINKTTTTQKAERFIRDSLNPVRWAEIVLVSALTGKRCDNIYDAVDRAREAHGRRVPTAILNEVGRSSERERERER